MQKELTLLSSHFDFYRQFYFTGTLIYSFVCAQNKRCTYSVKNKHSRQYVFA